jgi:hypothetical protein
MRKLGRSIPGTSALARRNGIEVGQAPAQMPQLTHRPGLTTASRSNARPSVRGIMVMALYGQSLAQRVQPLQLARSTTATGARLSGGSQGSMSRIRTSAPNIPQLAAPGQLSIRG